VCSSSTPSHRIACSRVSPHISGIGRSDTQTAGRSGRPNSRQRRSSASWMQRTPAGLPTPSTTGMPGIGELMEGAMQQAAQRGRQSMA